MTTLIAITAEPLVLDDHLRAVGDPAAGAVATFIGRVRNHDPEAESRVVELEYSAHPDAAWKLGEIVADCIPSGTAVAASHRVGTLGVGDTAIIVCVATAHRAEAFRLCHTLVDRIKAELPVWKQQREADGASTWVGLS